MIDAGLIWIGPPPAAIDSLGDKVKARHIAEKVGAPLVAGTPDPVADAPRSSRSPSSTACRSRSRRRTAVAAAA